MRIWSSTGLLRAELGGHVGGVCALDFSPDGHRLATWAGDGAFRQWNPVTGECLAAFRVEPSAHQTGWLAGGSRLYALGDHGLYLFDVRLGGARAMHTPRLRGWAASRP